VRKSRGGEGAVGHPHEEAGLAGGVCFSDGPEISTVSEGVPRDGGREKALQRNILGVSVV